MVDGKVFRWMGPSPYLGGGKEIPALQQTSLQVTATRSLYTFQGAGIQLDVEFCSPLLADDLDVLSRPCSYLTLSETATDGKAHKVRCYFDLTGEFVVNDTGDRVDAKRLKMDNTEVVSMRSVDHLPLSKTGDRVRCDWGTIYVEGPGQSFISNDVEARNDFAQNKIPNDDDKLPRPAEENWPVIGYQFDLGSEPETLAVAYDEGYALEFMGRRERPYWNRKNIGPLAMLRQAVDEFPQVHGKCVKLDESIAKEAGALSPEYAQLMALAYRQALAANGMAQDFSAGLLFFPKEQTSNGCIDTTDVVFPGSPFLLYFNPNLLKAQIVPLMLYAESDYWPFDFAPHDLGTYPLANGQVYGGGEVSDVDQMPVEESSDILLMLAGLEQKQPDLQLLKSHWQVLSKWANYLKHKGLDPENQLCTDDFSGHLAHNANLSIKAIIALRGYASLAKSIGDSADASEYKALSEKWAKQWPQMAAGGSPTTLAFGQRGTWSIKYNLMWDRLLNYHLFPASIGEGEINSYLSKANSFGVPLDNRATFVKTDWLFWGAAMSTTKAQFNQFTAMVYKFANETPDRVPFSDWYDTKSAKNMGMDSRSVIGGVAAPLLLRSIVASRTAR